MLYGRIVIRPYFGCDFNDPHPPPDLPLARGAKRLRSAKGEESREARDDFPPLQGEGQGGGGAKSLPSAGFTHGR